MTGRLFRCKIFKNGVIYINMQKSLFCKKCEWNFANM
nr:MAG TPA: hypothetical protein [Caudoviricetes sp.]DAZ74625.1 MAG TPA: hypothetical protein [Caudoviricetes sp.]